MKFRTTLLATPTTSSSELESLFAEVHRDDRPSAGTGASAAWRVPQAPGIATLRSARTQFERDYITVMLERHDWRVTDVARVLGVDPANLYRKMRRLRISRASARETL